MSELDNPHDAAKRRSIGFLNWAHAIDHYVLLIYPTVVIGLQAIYGRSYADLIALSTASFVAFGVFSLPAGWLADRISRRDMMAIFYTGCGASLCVASWAPDLITLASALFLLGKQTRDKALLAQAVAAFKQAEDIYRGQGTARMVAVTEKNLARAADLLESIAPSRVPRMRWEPEP